MACEKAKKIFARDETPVRVYNPYNPTAHSTSTVGFVQSLIKNKGVYIMTASWAPNMVIFMGTFMFIIYLAMVLLDVMLAEIPEDELELPKLKVVRRVGKQNRYGA